MASPKSEGNERGVICGHCIRCVKCLNQQWYIAHHPHAEPPCSPWNQCVPIHQRARMKKSQSPCSFTPTVRCVRACVGVCVRVVGMCCVRGTAQCTAPNTARKVFHQSKSTPVNFGGARVGGTEHWVPGQATHRCPCVGKPCPAATVSSLITRRAPKLSNCIRKRPDQLNHRRVRHSLGPRRRSREGIRQAVRQLYPPRNHAHTYLRVVVFSKAERVVALEPVMVCSKALDAQKRG